MHLPTTYLLLRPPLQRDRISYRTKIGFTFTCKHEKFQINTEKIFPTICSSFLQHSRKPFNVHPTNFSRFFLIRLIPFLISATFFFKGKMIHSSFDVALLKFLSYTITVVRIKPRKSRRWFDFFFRTFELAFRWSKRVSMLWHPYKVSQYMFAMRHFIQFLGQMHKFNLTLTMTKAHNSIASPSYWIMQKMVLLTAERQQITMRSNCQPAHRAFSFGSTKKKWESISICLNVSLSSSRQVRFGYIVHLFCRCFVGRDRWR